MRYVLRYIMDMEKEFHATSAINKERRNAELVSEEEEEIPIARATILLYLPLLYLLGVTTNNNIPYDDT